jgi:hypothetical protein
MMEDVVVLNSIYHPHPPHHHMNNYHPHYYQSFKQSMLILKIEEEKEEYLPLILKRQILIVLTLQLKTASVLLVKDKYKRNSYEAMRPHFNVKKTRRI